MTEESILVNVKWGKQKFENVELFTGEGVPVFKMQLYSLTGVPPDRQKIMGVKGGMLKDDATWEAAGVKAGHNFMLVGTADEVPELPKEDSMAIVNNSSNNNNDDAVTGYPPGLKNLGNTCYLNATLQVLNVVPELHDALISYSGNVASNNSNGGDSATSITAATRDLFKILSSSKSSVTPMIFLTVFQRVFPQFAQRTPQGHPMQQDAEECLNQLMTAMSQKLTISTPIPPFRIGNNLIDRLFGAQLVTTYKCLESPNEPVTERIETIRKLSCHISIKINFMLDGIVASLDETISKRSDVLGRDAEYQKSSRLATLPEYVLVHFVRFFWKADTQTRAKILRNVQYPTVFDIMSLCTDGLKEKLRQRRLALREAEDKEIAAGAYKPSTSSDVNNNINDSNNNNSSGNNADSSDFKDIGLYDLVGVITHVGRQADSGHYIGWAKHGNAWLKFDDEDVSTCTEDEVKKLSGGGDWHISYINLYKAKKTLR